MTGSPNKFLVDSLVHPEVTTLLLKLQKIKELPNLIFIGPPGTGKTTTAKDIIENFLETRIEYLELNSSCDRGIGTIREVVVPFSSKLSSISPIRMVLFEEAQNLTSEAQAALRNTMQVSSNCRFIFTCNKDSLDPAIKSRCVTVPFKINQELLEKVTGLTGISDLRYANRIVEKSLLKGPSLLERYYSVILSKDISKSRQFYFKIVSGVLGSLPTVTQIRNTYKLLSLKQYREVTPLLLDLFIRFENDIYITQEQFLPIIRFLHDLSLIYDKEIK